LLGIRVGEYGFDALLGAAMQSVDERRAPFTFACANPHSLVTAQSDSEFQAALRACSAVVADGVGVTLAARLVGVDVGPRITGTDFFVGLMGRLNRRGGRVFFLGSHDDVLTRIITRTRREYPNVYVEVMSPPFGAWSDAVQQLILSRIHESRPDILWVGMTAPKQEKWVHRTCAQLDVPVIGSIGAVFDYYAQTVVRAPDWLCKLGLEWLYRLSKEPRRLWRRTFISGPAFLWLLVRARFRERDPA
jgi:N-acetylglucosaminyldiphosphoundecaprenol N-acetyl-beta-D-mannosaminyltransferase